MTRSVWSPYRLYYNLVKHDIRLTVSFSIQHNTTRSLDLNFDHFAPRQAWQAYIKLEERYSELNRASALYERWIACRPTPKNWVTWSKFEEDRGEIDKAREVFQTALEFFGDGEEEVDKAQGVFGAFARMETRLKEFERARTIYKVG